MIKQAKRERLVWTMNDRAMMMDQELKELRHPQGLRLRLPEGLLTETTSSGFVIRAPDWKESRRPFEITVSLLKDQPAEGQFGNIRQANSQAVHYGIERLEGGSGGPTHVLTAWKSSEGKYVLLRHSVQTEALSEPDFSLAWSVIEGAGSDREAAT